MKYFLATIAFLSITITFHINAEELDTDIWHLKHEKDGVLIYAKKDPHHSIKDLKMTSVIRGKSLSSFVALFQDLDSYPDWVYSCNEAELVKKISDTQIVYYMYSNFPWPMSDRDFVLHNKIWQNPTTGAFHSKSIAYNNFMDKTEGVVRVTHFTAEWIITPIKEENFELLYTFSADPAGQIPSWIVNTFAEVGPLKTISQMEIQAKKQKYAYAKIHFVKEKFSKSAKHTELLE